MTRRIQPFVVRVCLSALLVASAGGSVAAQGFIADARRIGMGAVGATDNIAADMVEPLDPYTVIVLPLGLIQIVRDIHRFNPSSADFDPILAIEDAANPLHYTFGRSTSNPGQKFVGNLVNFALNRDLSAYRVFVMPPVYSTQALASPNAGPLIKFAKTREGGFQGIYLGTGPYLSFSTTANADPKLVDILGSETAKYYPNSAFQMIGHSAAQVAAAITGGYRTHISAGGSASPRDGVYFGLNYNYLYGYRYFAPDLTIRFDTDAQGLVTFNASTTPIVVDDLRSKSGRGSAVDVGLDIVTGPWEAGVSVNGIANHITWTGLELTRHTVQSLTQAGTLVDQPLPAPAASARVELPVVTTFNVGYDTHHFAARADLTNGFNGRSIHAGVELKSGPFAVRAGGRYSHNRWNPTVGVGLGAKVALDLALYTTTANYSGAREVAMAASIRINHAPPRR